MTGQHDADRSSSPSRRASCSDANESMYSASFVLTMMDLPHYLISSDTAQGMPLPERNRYSNKESWKVNAGLNYGSTHGHGVERAFKSNGPVVDIDFKKLTVPKVQVERAPTVDQLVARLLQPPQHAFVYGVLSIQWVIGALGAQHFDFRSSDERHVLAVHSALRIIGALTGLPAIYLEWLCGDDENMTAAEQGVCLTPEFFEHLAQDA